MVVISTQPGRIVLAYISTKKETSKDIIVMQLGYIYLITISFSRKVQTGALSLSAHNFSASRKKVGISQKLLRKYCNIISGQNVKINIYILLLLALCFHHNVVNVVWNCEKLRSLNSFQHFPSISSLSAKMMHRRCSF